MDPIALRAYLLALLLLTLKYAAVTTVQGKLRFATRTFRWPEDARAWHGRSEGGREHELVERAQALLRNDAESQPLFLAASAAWIALGAEGTAAALALPAYALARGAHAWFFLRPRQPARNRAFVLGQLVLLGVLVDALRRAIVG